jgi:hypothetical protein
MFVSDSICESSVRRLSQSTSNTSFVMHLHQVSIARLPLEMYQMLDLGKKVTSLCCLNSIKAIIIELCGVPCDDCPVIAVKRLRLLWRHYYFTIWLICATLCFTNRLLLLLLSFSSPSSLLLLPSFSSPSSLLLLPSFFSPSSSSPPLLFLPFLPSSPSVPAL